MPEAPGAIGRQLCLYSPYKIAAKARASVIDVVVGFSTSSTAAARVKRLRSLSLREFALASGSSPLRHSYRGTGGWSLTRHWILDPANGRLRLNGTPAARTASQAEHTGAAHARGPRSQFNALSRERYRHARERASSFAFGKFMDPLLLSRVNSEIGD